MGGNGTLRTARTARPVGTLKFFKIVRISRMGRIARIGRIVGNRSNSWETNERSTRQHNTEHRRYKDFYQGTIWKKQAEQNAGDIKNSTRGLYGKKTSRTERRKYKEFYQGTIWKKKTSRTERRR